MLMEVCGDQLTAFLKTITEPYETIAPWVCVRALLEAAALVNWLLAPDIDVQVRVRRSIALRYEELKQQRRFVKAIGQDTSAVTDRMLQVTREVAKLGYAALHDRRNRQTGLATPMPSTTDLVRIGLDEEGLYRLAAAVAHGHGWAIRHVSFRMSPNHVVPEATGPWKALEKVVNPNVILFLSLYSAKSFGMAAWRHVLHYGWDEAAIRSSLSRLFDTLGASEEVRFWQRSE